MASDDTHANRIEQLLQKTRRQKHAYQSAANKARHAPLKLKVFTVALWVLKLSDNAQVAAQYLAMRRRRDSRWEVPSASDLRVMLAEASARALSLEAFAEQEIEKQNLKRKAEEYLAHVDLVTWIHRQNVQKGLAPSSASVLREKKRLGGSVALDSRPPTRRGQKQWVRRWSQRFGIYRGRFKVGNRISTEEARAKAGTIDPCCFPECD
jgi:hypothetical protein